MFLSSLRICFIFCISCFLKDLVEYFLGRWHWRMGISCIFSMIFVNFLSPGIEPHYVDLWYQMSLSNIHKCIVRGPQGQFFLPFRKQKERPRKWRAFDILKSLYPREPEMTNFVSCFSLIFTYSKWNQKSAILYINWQQLCREQSIAKCNLYYISSSQISHCKVPLFCCLADWCPFLLPGWWMLPFIFNEIWTWLWRLIFLFVQEMLLR